MGPAAEGGQLAKRVDEYSQMNDRLAGHQDPASPTVEAAAGGGAVAAPAPAPAPAAALAGRAAAGEAALPLPPPIAVPTAGKGSAASRRRSDHRCVAAIEVQSYAVDSPSFAASEAAAARSDGEASVCSPVYGA